MKIIVDEMPAFCDECPFCKMDFGEYICSRSDLECNIDMCDFLKPITDYVTDIKKSIRKQLKENLQKPIGIYENLC